MIVTGPNWESTRRLQEAVRGFNTTKTLAWGCGGKDGYQQLESFRAAGINCPTFTADLFTAKSWAKEGKETWGRDRHHTQGSDIVCDGYSTTTASPAREEMRWITTRKGNRVQRPRIIPATAGGESWNPKWLRKDFWVVRVVGVKNEYRQHIFNDEAIRRGKKVFDANTIERRAERVVDGVRSRKNGWHIDYGPFTSPPALRDIAKKAVKSLGYLWGAVDIIETDDGKLWVLEVNSAPSLKDDNTLKAYVDAIRRWVG